MESAENRPEGRPFVVAHVGVSLDGATRGLAVNLERFYGLSATWHEDVTLTGADTVLAQEETLASTPGPGPAAGGPLLAVVDGRARVRRWQELRDAGYWSDVIALRSETTPPRPGTAPVRELVCGSGRVDLAAALHKLATDHGAKVVRVDSGGALIGALLAAGLLDEVSLLVHPVLVGAGPAGRWYGSEPGAAALRLIAEETFDDGVVWLRYEVER